MVEENRKDPPDGLKTNKFRNVKDKVRNRSLSNETAWGEAQPFLKVCVEDYPVNYHPYISLIKTIFGLRRDAYLNRIATKDASQEIIRLVRELKSNEQVQIEGLVICVRDLFDIHANSSRTRSFR